MKFFSSIAAALLVSAQQSSASTIRGLQATSTLPENPYAVNTVDETASYYLSCPIIRDDIQYSLFLQVILEHSGDASVSASTGVVTDKMQLVEVEAWIREDGLRLAAEESEDEEEGELGNKVDIKVYQTSYSTETRLSPLTTPLFSAGAPLNGIVKLTPEADIVFDFGRTSKTVENTMTVVVTASMIDEFTDEAFSIECPKTIRGNRCDAADPSCKKIA